MADFNPVQTSPYSFSYKLKSRLWCFVNRTFYRWSPFFMRKYRVALVRLVGGGEVDWSCSLDATATIIDPWNLTMGPYSSLGEYCCIRCRSKVVIGEKSCIGRGVYILTAAHDVNSPNFKMESAPVFIGDYVWVATRATILKGVSIGTGAVVGAESLVTKDIESWMIVGGNPAKVIKKRIISEK